MLLTPLVLRDEVLQHLEVNEQALNGATVFQIQNQLQQGVLDVFRLYEVKVRNNRPDNLHISDNLGYRRAYLVADKVNGYFK